MPTYTLPIFGVWRALLRRQKDPIGRLLMSTPSRGMPLRPRITPFVIVGCSILFVWVADVPIWDGVLLAVVGFLSYLTIALFAGTAQMTSGIAGGAAYLNQLQHRDLLRITTLPKTQLFMSQIAAIGGFVWPILRVLIILRFLLVTIVLLNVIAVMLSPELVADVPTGLYLLALMPIAVLLVFMPVIQAGIVASISIYMSSFRFSEGVAVTWSLMGNYGFQVLSVVVLLLILGGNVSPIFVLACAPVSAFFWGWLPIGAIIVLGSTNGGTTTFIGEILLTWGTLMTIYIILPLVLSRMLLYRAARNLDRATL